MKTLAIVFSLVMGFIIMVAAGIGLTLLGMYDEANEMEQSITAAYTEYVNTYSNYTTKIQEIGQVPEMYKNDLREVFTDVVKGRYGKDGSQAVFQFIKEHNPDFDSSLYTKIQQVMEAGRNEIKVKGTFLIDTRTPYLTAMGGSKQLIYKFMGFPRIDMEKMQPFKSNEAATAEKTGITEAVKLR